MHSIINGFRKYTIKEKDDTTEDILGFYPESCITGDLSSLKDEEILCDFIIKEKLGEGAFGSVRLGVNRQTGEKVAIKILEKNKLKFEDKCRIEREIKILKKLRHPNIVHLYSIIETEKQILIITEYIQGQELFHYILLKKKISEEEACYYFSQIVSGVEYLHKLKIAHRDIKSENILIDQNTKRIKLIDFGLSNTYGDKDEGILSTSCGSPLYAPPEMLKGEIYKGNTVDIWSIGVVLYFMICGYLPFQDTDNDKLFKKIIKGKFNIPMHVSTQGRELLYKLMDVNPKKRINISQIKNHPWVRLYTNDNNNFLIFNPGLNLEKYVIPIDEEIVDELYIKYNISKIKLRENILLNKNNDYTTLYELLLNKKISEGKKSVADLKSEIFLNYIKDKKNLMSCYNNDIKKVIKNRKIGFDINLENNELDKNKSCVKSQQELYNSNNELNKNKTCVKSQQELYNINNDFNINTLHKKKVNSPRFKSNIYLISNFEKNNKNKYNLNLISSIITEKENNAPSLKNKKTISTDTPFQKNKNRITINKVKKYKKINSQKNRINSVENSLFVDKENISSISNTINNNKKNKKIRKFVSSALSKSEKDKINKLLRNKPNSVHKDINIKTENKNDLLMDENHNNINENTKEKINRLLSESKIINTEENNTTINEKISEKNIHQNENKEKNENSNSNEQKTLKKNSSNNSKSNNYLITDEKTKFFQTLDSFSSKNYNEDNIFTNFIVQNVNMISFFPEKKEDKTQQNNENKNRFYKVQKKLINKNRINLIKNKIKTQCDKGNLKQKEDSLENKNRTPNVIQQKAKIKKNLENKKLGLSLMYCGNNLDKISLIHNNSCSIRKTKDKIVDTENLKNKKRNSSLYNMQDLKKQRIKKNISLDNNFINLKNNNLSLEFNLNEEKNISHSLKIRKRNNKKILSNTQINKDILQNSKSIKDSNRNTKELKLKESNNEINIHINIHRNNLNTKTYNVFSERQKHNTFYQNQKCDILDISNIAKNKNSQIIGTNHLNYDNNKTFFIDNNNNNKKYENNTYIPFDLSCAFIISRKKLKQKIENVCEKMKYKIKNINLYKFNIIPGDKIDNIFEINLPVNKLGIINIIKNKKGNLEQTNKCIKRILSKIK